jgi:hypothetical protein
MATALTLYPTATADANVATANTLLENATTGATLTNKNTNITANTTGWIDIWSQGNVSATSGAGSEPAPTGHGWLDDATTLVGNQFVAGTWSFAALFNNSGASGTFTADVHFRAYQRSSGGVYTLVAEAVAASQSIAVDSTGATYTAVTATVSALISNQFVSGNKVYYDTPLNILTNTTSGNIRVRMANSATLGSTSVQVVSPGYQVFVPPASGVVIISDGYGGLFT